MGLSTTYTKVETDFLIQQLEEKTSDKYNDQSNSIANDIIKFIDINTGENVNYQEVTTWHDGSAIDDTKVDGTIYKKMGNKYFVLTSFLNDLSVNVKLFGTTLNETDTTATFKRALSFLDKIGRGVLSVPLGDFYLNEQLKIDKPFIGIKGAGINVTKLHFQNCNGIELSGYADFSLAVLAELSIFGNNSANTIGINLPNANYYFLEKFVVAGFETGVEAETAVMSKFSYFTISGCEKGMTFTNGCYFLTVFNGNVRGCSEYGIGDFGNGVKILFTDVEAIGEYNSVNGQYENGTAIIASSGTSIQDCHIETSGFGIKVDNGGCRVENTFFGGCNIGVGQNSNDISGQFYFKNLTFSGTLSKDFELPTAVFYNIIDCKYFTGAGTVLNGIIDVSPLLGVIENFRYTAQGYEKEISAKDITLNGMYVFKGHKFTKLVDIGTIAANSTFQTEVELPDGLSTNEWGANAIANFQSLFAPQGIIILASVRNSSVTRLVLTIINVTSNAIDLGQKNVIFSVFN